MENASKALLMAGGVLIALMIIGALVLMFNQIGSYEKSQDASKKNSQLAEFNKEFERYLDDKEISGADVISLINKVIDYNNKAKNGGVNNSVDYDIKMSITISNLDSFNSKYAYNDESNKIFKLSSYTIGDNYDNKFSYQLKNDLDAAKNMENTAGISKDQLKQLSAMYDNGNKTESIENIKEKLVEINGDAYKNWNGNNMNPKLDTIIKYRQYWEFKTSKFKTDGNAVYQKGQIKDIKFKFYK